MTSQSRVQRLAHRLRIIVLLLIVTAALLLVASFAELHVGTLQVLRPIVDNGGIAGTALAILGALLVLAGLWQLVRMLALIEAGDRFSPRVTRRFRHFALLMLLAATTSAVATWFAPRTLIDPHHRALTLTIDFRDIWVMLVAGILFLVARLLDEAQRIEADLGEIV